METEILEEKKVTKAIDLKLLDVVYSISILGDIIPVTVTSLSINITNGNMLINGMVVHKDQTSIPNASICFSEENAKNHYITSQEARVKELAKELITKEKILELEINKLDELKTKLLLK